MSLLVIPHCAKASPTTGISISTSLHRSSRRSEGDCAKATTATSRIAVHRVALRRRIGLAGGLEVADVLQRGPPLLARPPHRLDPQARAHLGGGDALDEVPEGDVG